LLYTSADYHSHTPAGQQEETPLVASRVAKWMAGNAGKGAFVFVVCSFSFLRVCLIGTEGAQGIPCGW